MIRLVVFDLWLTLAYKEVEYDTLTHIIEQTGAPIGKDKIVKVFENTVQTKKWRSKHSAYKQLCIKIGLPPTESNIAKITRIRDHSEERAKLYPHTIPMLKQLRAQGYKTGLVSNSSVFAVKHIKEKTRLLDYIDYPVFSYNVGAVKPDLRLFREVLRRAKCRPDEAVMIGDKMGDDVLPPRKIGMNSIHYKGYPSLKKELAKLGVALK
ncbi:MAG: HAD family hydrolase [Candidatus Micrarchaeota archaeon]|nr:HAD family hydrolase [Candidatus Micrarchaeota archaeon]